MIGFRPFVAFRSGTRWALSLIELLKPIALDMQTQSRLFRSCLSNLGHIGQFNIKDVTVLDQIIDFNSHFVDSSAQEVKSFTKCF